jgi:(heptosyl)LPS beta-1,4-glucosyltransferase
MITRNEEAGLARCLERLDFATEIVVADSGSTDRTVQVAQRFTPHVFQVSWQGFGPSKQQALLRATGDWVLSLDADEVVDDELRLAILHAVSRNDPAISGFRLNRRSNFLGRWMGHSGWYPDRITRLVRRTQARFSEHAVHEQLLVDGRLSDLPGHLLHYTDPDWPHYLAKLSRYAELSAQALHAKGRRSSWWDLTVRPAYQFVRTYILQRGFLDGRAGFLLACGSAFHVFSKYATLWTLSRNSQRCSS